MGGYIDSQGNYYEGDRQGADLEVPARPDATHAWDGAQWVPSPDLVNAGIWAQITELERREQMPRSLRDLAKKACAADASALGMTLDQVYQAALLPNAPSAALQWKKFKDFEDEIARLKRELLK